MDGIAPKISQEVDVFLQYHDVHPSARQQETQHHPRGTAAGDAAADLYHLRLSHIFSVQQRTRLSHDRTSPTSDLPSIHHDSLEAQLLCVVTNASAISLPRRATHLASEGDRKSVV